MKLYLCSPYLGGNSEGDQDTKTKTNIKYAQECMRELLLLGHSVYAGHLLYPQVLNEWTEREIGFNAGLDFLKCCDALIICDKFGISKGMKKEMEKASVITTFDRFIEIQKSLRKVNEK